MSLKPAVTRRGPRPVEADIDDHQPVDAAIDVPRILEAQKSCFYV